MDNESEYIQSIGEKVRTFRLQKGLTQLQLSIDSKIPLSQIGAIERGVANPTAKTLKRISDSLEISIKDLFD